MKDKHDVIIIGAGIGGLVCGCYLAKAGLKVLLVEKNKRAGGCTSSYNLDGFNFDMGAHLIGGCNNNGLFSHYLRKLGIDFKCMKLCPGDRFIFEGKQSTVIDVPNDINEYILNLQRLFPAEKENLERFFDEMVKIYRSYLLNKSSLQKYKLLSYQQFLNEFIKDKRLQGVLSAHCPYVGLPPKMASVIAVSFMMVSYLRDGTYISMGGIQNLVELLCKKIIENSGDIIYSTEVKKICLKNNKVIGISSNDNNFIEGKVIVSNIDAEKTFFTLVGYENLREIFIKKIKNMKKGISVLQMHVGTDISASKLKNITNGWYYQNYDLNACLKDAFYVFIPTLFDNTLAPKGKNIIQMLKISHYEIEKIKDWKIVKKDIRRYFLEKFETVGNIKLKNKILTEIITTPKDIENFTGNSRGSVYGWEMSPECILDKRLSHVTPINNLFLVGHWTNPGCGVLGVAASGIEAGKEILSNFYD